MTNEFNFKRFLQHARDLKEKALIAFNWYSFIAFTSTTGNIHGQKIKANDTDAPFDFSTSRACYYSGASDS